MGNFKEALMLSQQARKIIGQIEEYSKIKSVESQSAVKIQSEVKQHNHKQRE
ncbi:MAG: hypothetical protein R3B55_01985 [Candidatus Paceibacterota bacterium]